MFVRSTLGTMSCYGLVVDTGGMSCVVTSEWDMLEVFNMVMKVWNKLFSDDKIQLEVQQNM